MRRPHIGATDNIRNIPLHFPASAKNYRLWELGKIAWNVCITQIDSNKEIPENSNPVLREMSVFGEFQQTCLLRLIHFSNIFEGVFKWLQCWFDTIGQFFVNDILHLFSFFLRFATSEFFLTRLQNIRNIDRGSKLDDQPPPILPCSRSRFSFLGWCWSHWDPHLREALSPYSSDKRGEWWAFRCSPHFQTCWEYRPIAASLRRSRVPLPTSWVPDCVQEVPCVRWLVCVCPGRPSRTSADPTSHRSKGITW